MEDGISKTGPLATAVHYLVVELQGEIISELGFVYGGLVKESRNDGPVIYSDQITHGGCFPSQQRSPASNFKPRPWGMHESEVGGLFSRHDGEEGKIWILVPEHYVSCSGIDDAPSSGRNDH